MTLHLESLGACPLCERTRLRTVMQVPDFETATGEYGLVECHDCGLAFTSPRPLESDLPALYEERATADFPDMRARAVQCLRERAIDTYLARQLGHLASPAPDPMRVLDFGCGDGALSLGLQRYAMSRGTVAQVTAVDFHDAVPPALAGTSGRGTSYMSYGRWNETDGTYDAMFLRHVLEHHPDPRRLLRRLREAIRTGGRLFIEVPNRRSVWARVFGAHYFGYYMPRHLMHFDAASLRLAAESSGLRCVSLRPGHTPLLGRSISYRTGWNIGNLGLIGLASYPLQVLVDRLARTSSTLQLIAMPNA